MQQQRYLFFSIIIPAHNEEHYITNTIERLLALDYPMENYEVIAVENGSNDRTYEKAKQLEKLNVKVFTSHIKGVSAAKNTGIAKLSQKTDWVIFLDADTILQKNFLKNLNNFLIINLNRNYAVGTTEIKPLSEKITAKFWFAFYNLGHRLTKTSYSLQIVKYSLLKKVHFDERLVMGEDLKLIRDASQYGRFFYFLTKDVYTSTRRFEQEGWLKVFFHWIFVSLLPYRIQKYFTYKTIR